MNPVYCAIDSADASAALQLAEAVAPHVGGLKFGLEFFYSCGADAVRRIADATGLPLFLDLKLHDIPNTVSGGLRALLRWQPAIINVHCQGGSAMLSAARAVVAELSPTTRLVGVTLLTSLDADDLRIIGVPASPGELVTQLATLARQAGLAGVVCSAQEVAGLVASWPEGFFVVPGIRPAENDAGDQKRVMTPRAALDAGASVLVIGRPITAAADPARAAAAIAASLGC